MWPLVLVGRVVDRIGKGFRGAPRDALLAEGVANDQLGRVYGFHRAAGVATADGAGDTAPRRLPGKVRLVAGILAIIALLNFPDALLLLRLHEVGLSTGAVVAVYALFNAANALIAYPAGALADMWPRARV